MSRTAFLSASAVLVGLVLPASPTWADGPTRPPTKQECVSANEAAQDLLSAGKLREARDRLAVCTADACPTPVRDDCTRRLDVVQKAIPSLLFEVRDESGHPVSAVSVTMDGALLADGLDGAAIPVDPGQHTFVFEVESRPKVTRTLVLQEGERNRRERVALVATTAAAASPEPASKRTPPEAPTPRSSWGTQRGLGLALGVAGIAGLTLGSVFGLVSKAEYDHALTFDCGPAAGYASPKTCDATGARDVQSAHTQAAVSTAGFFAGGALLAAGAVLYLSAPKGGRLTVESHLGPDRAAIGLRGAW